MEKKKKQIVNPEEAAGAASENMEGLTAGTVSSCAADPELTGGEEQGDSIEAVPEEQPDGAAAPDWVREREELINLAQRKQADLDNFRRISRMKEEEIRRYGLSGFLERLLPVLDNMERALVTAREDKSIPESHVKGLLMIQKQLMQLLEQEGVVVIEAQGKPFDPNYHEAVMQAAGDEGEPGTVIEEFLKGYLYKERVLRPSKVKVVQSQQ